MPIMKVINFCQYNPIDYSIAGTLAYIANTQ